jgi:hypothetical protein
MITLPTCVLKVLARIPTGTHIILIKIYKLEYIWFMTQFNLVGV